MYAPYLRLICITIEFSRRYFDRSWMRCAEKRFHKKYQMFLVANINTHALEECCV
jgi:hypothetical protein